MKRAMNGLARKLAGCLKLFAKEQRGLAASLVFRARQVQEPGLT